jgi:hypothetical protein
MALATLRTWKSKVATISLTNSKRLEPWASKQASQYRGQGCANICEINVPNSECLGQQNSMLLLTNQCAFISEMRLITQKFGIHVYVHNVKV